MAPAKKSSSVNKRFPPTTEISPSKDGNGDNLKKSFQRKRKLSDMLGPKWSDEDLTHFYQAYRKYGKDWKKVAGAVKPRTAEMVEALYTMNRAYLSLPEGTASVVGLIAMMTDHYCNLAASDSEQESNEDAGTSRRPQKRARVKIQPNVSKTSEVASPTLAAAHGCLSLLKKKRSGGSRPRAVGKRTPRFPVSFSHENPMGEKYFSPSRRSLKLQADDTDDDVKIALVLTEASQRGGSPQVSQTLNRWTDSAMSSPVETSESKRVKMGMDDGKLLSNEVDEEEGSMEADTGELLRYKNDLMDTGTISRTAQKGRRPYGEKLEVDSGDNHFDDIKEACSGTEEGQRLGAMRGKREMEASDEKNSRTSLQGPRKRSKKMFLRRDEDSPFDALQTLADLSLMMPTTENEDESMILVKDDIDDHVDESGSLEAVPANKERDKRGSAGVRSRWSQPVSKFGVASSKTSKHGKVRPTDVSAVPETKHARRAQKAMLSKARKTEDHINNGVTDSQEAEAKELSKKSTNKGKRSNQSVSLKLIKDQEHASSADPRTERSDSAQSTAQIPVENQVNLSVKSRSRRKMDLKKPQRQKKLKIPDKSLDDTSASDRAFSLREKISNCLSKHQVRSWCIYEWFYSAIDYPWFAKREFVEYLDHVGLGHVPRLTRVEWGVIRSSLGRPRRFSKQFLNEEREKLNQYRESVRTHYNELREGTREGLPTDLARPLSVGQRVIAIHPKTREMHDGSVLTVDRSRCRVQFDRPELGVEFVMDFECMPLNPSENMPTSLKRHADGVDKFFESFNELKVNARANEFMKFPVGDNMENGDVFSHFSPPSHPITNLLMQTKVASAEADMQCKSGVMETAAYQQATYPKLSLAAQIQAKEADVQALVEFTRALDKKDAVVSELRRMNDDVLESQKSNDCSLKDSELFKKQYAAVLTQLNEVNEQVSSALYRLRQRNNYPGIMPLAWPRPVTNFVDPSVLSTFDRCTSQPQDSGFLVNEIIESSKIKARTMVDAAVQAIISFSGRENTSEKIEAAIDYVNDRIPLDESCMPTPPDPKSKNMSDRNEPEIPSELISKCVATLLMIQKCTERQLPPGDVAKVLDSAVASLQPCCSPNSPVYGEIQKCMGIIKNQIMALIPT